MHATARKALVALLGLLALVFAAAGTLRFAGRILALEKIDRAQTLILHADLALARRPGVTLEQLVCAGELESTRDPWGRPLRLSSTDGAWSDGPDGVPETSDDLGGRRLSAQGLEPLMLVQVLESRLWTR